MALANQKKHLLLSTGNKSELAVGYCTLYGDMNGGLSVIGDLFKTSVFGSESVILVSKLLNPRYSVSVSINWPFGNPTKGKWDNDKISILDRLDNWRQMDVTGIPPSRRTWV